MGKNLSLTHKILLSMILGILVGLLLQSFLKDNQFVQTYIINGFLDVGGTIFIASLKMLVVPLVFVSLVCGSSALRDLSTLGRLGSKTLLFYLCTTGLAISIALVMGFIFQPGVGIDLTTHASVHMQDSPSLKDVFIHLFPTNPLDSMAKGETLQIIVFAILFGVAIGLAGEAGERVASFFADLNEIIMQLVSVLIKFAPYGVFCLMAKVFTDVGIGAILNLAMYFFALTLTLLIHGVLVYGFLFKVFTGLSPVIFLRKMKNTIIFAFSTASSNATIPMNMETSISRMGVNNKIASFTIPLGATINMDGTAIMQGMATAFISQAYQIDLSISDYLAVIATAILASIGTAGVPGVGLIMLAMVLNQVGLPVEGIGMIMGVDRLLDMIRTSVNVTGDNVVTCIVAHSENELDQTIFHNPDAGLDDTSEKPINA